MMPFSPINPGRITEDRYLQKRIHRATPFSLPTQKPRPLRSAVDEKAFDQYSMTRGSSLACATHFLTIFR